MFLSLIFWCMMANKLNFQDKLLGVMTMRRGTHGVCETDLHSLARSLSQYMQSAALPDMVPSRYGLISMTLL